MHPYRVDPLEFCRRLRELRLERGYTQEQLASRARIGDKHYQKLELGMETNPELETLNKLAEALEVPVYALLYNPIELKTMLKA